MSYETVLVSRASHQSHQFAKELSMKKEASPNMVNMHFREIKQLTHSLCFLQKQLFFFT